jgi:hypothetical protein
MILSKQEGKAMLPELHGTHQIACAIPVMLVSTCLGAAHLGIREPRVHRSKEHLQDIAAAGFNIDEISVR